MPIRPELRKFYGAEWKRRVRPRILERAGHKCQQCGKSNHSVAYVYCQKVNAQRIQYWAQKGGSVWRDSSGMVLPRSKWPAPGMPRKIRVILQIAHLNHVAGDDREENLRALCGWCHLHWDADEHRNTRALRKDASRPLLQQLTLAVHAEASLPARSKSQQRTKYGRRGARS
jgi:hypothetical protein